jgi:hypothetical protein
MDCLADLAAAAAAIHPPLGLLARLDRAIKAATDWELTVLHMVPEEVAVPERLAEMDQIVPVVMEAMDYPFR